MCPIPSSEPLRCVLKSLATAKSLWGKLLECMTDPTNAKDLLNSIYLFKLGAWLWAHLESGKRSEPLVSEAAEPCGGVRSSAMEEVLDEAAPSLCQHRL
jgi:hypothetical protein